MAYALSDGEGGWIEIVGTATISGVNYPPSWFEAASPEDRATLGVAEIVEPSAPAAGLRATGSTISDVGGAPVRAWITEAHVPPEVSRRQARLALAVAGLLTDVEAAVAAADQMTQIFWADSPSFHRDHPLIAAIAAALTPPLDDAAIDALFVDASTR